MANAGERNDPFVAFRFEVQIDNKPVGGFSEVSGLQLETEVESYQEGGLNTHELKFPTRTKQSNLTLKRGIVDASLWDWYDELVQGRATLRNGTIRMYDPSGKEVRMEWSFERAFPCKWMGPDLNATQNNVAVETLELCYHILKREP